MPQGDLAHVQKAILNPHFILLSFSRAFDTYRKGLLKFRDVLLGLAAMEPCTQHGGSPAEMRCRYIFRYYDENTDGMLQYGEFRLVFTSIVVHYIPISHKTSYLNLVVYASQTIFNRS